MEAYAVQTTVDWLENVAWLLWLVAVACLSKHVQLEYGEREERAKLWRAKRMKQNVNNPL